MFKNYLLTAWRNILKNGMFSAINIFGLALGLMSCILIMLFVREESGFDRWIEDSESVVRMHTAYYSPDGPPFLTVRSAGSMMEAVRDYAKNEVEDGFRLVRYGATLQKDDDAFSQMLNFVDGSFFNVINLPFAHGSADTSFVKPLDLVITESAAIRYFGRTDVVGEILTFCCNNNETVSLPVTGVIKDLPEATHLDIEMLVYILPALFGEPGTLQTWTSVNVYTYFKMRPGITLPQFQERLTYWVDNESPFVEMSKRHLGEMADNHKPSEFMKHKLMMVEDLHLNAKQDAGNMGDLTAMGDQNMIYTFTLVAGLILVIACINFMNLATARASQRAREVAMRKVLGASRGQVAIQFLGEAILIVMIALLFALVLVEAALPFYNDALNRNLELQLLDDGQLLLSLLVVGLFVGIGAGLYPALFLSRFMPGHMLRGSKSAESGNSSSLRTALVVFQFATSIALVVSTAVIYTQTKYAQSMDLGYVSDNKLVLNMRMARNVEGLRQELLNLPEVTSVTYSSEAPTQDNENNNYFRLIDSNGVGQSNENVLLNYHNMDFGFFQAYEVEPLAGRLFDESFGTDRINPQAQEGEPASGNIILNVSGARKLGFSSPEQAIGRVVESSVTDAGAQPLTIIGVIPDIYFRSLKFEVRPTAFLMNPDRFRVANLTFDTDKLPALVSKIEAVWKNHVPMQPIDLQFLSEMMSAQYQDEVVQARLFAVFSALAIIVACLGLYGLAAFTTERRTREIGIRKVMGAGVRDIVGLLIWQFSKPVFMANLIAWPVAIYLMQSWLESFQYRIGFGWLLPICFLVGLVLLLIAWGTVGGNAARVAKSNPIHALRQE